MPETKLLKWHLFPEAGIDFYIVLISSRLALYQHYLLQMANLFIKKLSKQKQYLYSFTLVTIVAVICYYLSAYIGYRVDAFLLLVTVSIIASLFDIRPVLFSACLSALVWDYLFIPPHFTLQVGSTEDLILLLMYFLIAMINAVLTYKIRTIEKIAMQREKKAHTLKLYSTLFNSLSHELRTPIATIIGATDNLQHNSLKLTDQNRYDLINEISIASFRLNQQVDNLLNMSRLESGFIEPKNDWCDVIEVVYDAVRRVEENGVIQKITIRINPALPLFKLDKGMLEQIIYNLLNNAVLYTPANSAINIEAACYDDILRVVIEDNGTGFPEDEINKVFDKFYRLKHSKAGGTGLGLSIVKGFTEAQNGIVKLQNKEEGGAIFKVAFPAAVMQLKDISNE